MMSSGSTFFVSLHYQEFGTLYKTDVFIVYSSTLLYCVLESTGPDPVLDIHSQSKKIIFYVYNYFKNLAKDSSQPEVSKFFLQAQQKTSEACGIHIKSVKRITAEGSKALLNTE
ncbi:general vesicular transport factor p115, partial [Aphis craccivora]